MIASLTPAPISILPAPPSVEHPIVELPKSQYCLIAMQAATSLSPLSKPKPRPCLVPQCPLPSPDPVSPPRSSVAAPSEAAESGTASDSTILPPSPKLKPKSCKPCVPSKAPVAGPSRASLPPHKKCHVHDPDSPPKSKVKTKASRGHSSSQSKSFLLLYFLSRANSYLLSSSLQHCLSLWHVCGSPSSRNGPCVVCAPFP